MLAIRLPCKYVRLRKQEPGIRPAHEQNLGVMRWAVFNIPMLFVLNHFIGMYGIVWSQVTADILTVALSAFVYFRFRSRLIRGEASM